MKQYLVVSVLFFSSCVYDPGDAEIQVINNSDSDIGISWSTTKSPSRYEIQLASSPEPRLRISDTVLLAETGANGWIRLIAKSPDRKVYFFVFYADSLAFYKDAYRLIEKGRFRRYDIRLGID